MTLPKTLSLASTNFNNFDTMSFEASNLNTSTSELNIQQPEQQREDQHQQQHHHLHQQTTNSNCPIPIASASLPLMETANVENNRSQVNPMSVEPQPVVFNSNSLVENVMPGIYLTKNFMSWKKEQLRTNGFTHIIIIDKHIQELYYPNQQPEIFKLCSSNISNSKRNNNDIRIVSSATADGLHDDSSSLNAFDYYCPPIAASATALNFEKDFEVINLNFGEKSYLTTVLPNCYRAVKFINKALQSGGTILVIDCNGGEQKCLTIIVAYLMYKYNISFSNAFARLKEFYTKADLDRFYTSQLYEYEPILQVQRAQSRGHSCSRELHAAILKRKKPHENDDDNNIPYSPLANGVLSDHSYTTTSDLFDDCNPLKRFDATQMAVRHDVKVANCQQTETQNIGNGIRTFTRMAGITTGGWYNWEDIAME